MLSLTPTTGAATYFLTNGAALDVDQLPVLVQEHFRAACLQACLAGGRLAALCALPNPAEPKALLAVIAHDQGRKLQLLSTPTACGDRFPSLTSDLPQAQAFERELWENAGLIPEGHPYLKPLRRHDVPYPFFRVDGPDVHEVAVGPVHAGIIEPGHFRSQCAGERLLHLEIHLGYQHRGVEALMLRANPARRLLLAESIAGDTAVGHATAYCLAMEALQGLAAPPRAQAVRAIALELERLANHVGDLGGLANDVAFQPAAARFGRLRGDCLNLLMALSGNRFGRGLLTVGGVRFDLDDAKRARLLAELARLERELRVAADLLFGTPGVINRFSGTGALSRQAALDLGLVGPTARATGLARDVRADHPHGRYSTEPVPVATAEGGDVLGRAQVRRLEIERSLRFVAEVVATLPVGPLCAVPRARRTDRHPQAAGPAVGSTGSARLLDPASSAGPVVTASRRLAVALVEGFRGEIAHVAMSGGGGELVHYKVVDPSFHNWYGEAIALRGNAISDFPLCNKSFNLSYAGHDL